MDIASLDLRLSTSSGVPIYLQIVNQLTYLVASGRLRAGDELPPIRTLAAALVVNPNTIARAYRELELSGTVEKRRTAGTFVADAPSPLARRERLRILSGQIDALLAQARQMNLSHEQLMDLIAQRERAMESNKSI